MNRNSLWQVAKIVLALGLVLYVLSLTNLNELNQLFHRIRLTWLAPCIGLYLITILIMSWRYKLLISGNITFRQLFGVVVLQTVIGNLIASAAGMASYVGVLRARYQIQIEQGIGSLVLAKIGDLIALSVTLGIASWAVWPQVFEIHILIVALLMAMCAAIAIFCTVYRWRHASIRVLRLIFNSTHLQRVKSIAGALSTLDAVADLDTRLLHRQSLQLLGASFALMAVQLLFAYCNMQLLNLPIDIWQTSFVLSMNLLISFLPIQVFGGLGISEISGLYLYGLFIQDTALLATFVVAARLYSWLLNLLILPYFLIDLRLRHRVLEASPMAKDV